MFSLEDTIIARSTAYGSALRGVLRLSGENALRVVNDILRPQIETGDTPRIFQGNLFPWEPERPIPVRVFFWPQGRGYTGQTSLELHLWGCEPILEAVQHRLLAGAAENAIRLAQPGEFTLRAFLAGRMDLTQAEAVLGVIDARDERHLEIALKQLAGGIGQPLHEVRENLLETLSHLEAGFDFVEEEIEFISETQLRERIGEAIARLEQFLKQIELRNLAGETPRVLLYGVPNAGKSSLYNALLDLPDAAIVSAIPGTTRDYLQTRLDVQGFVFDLVDSAGIDVNLAQKGESPQTPDLTAQRFSKEELRKASLILLCVSEEENFHFPECDDSIFHSVPVILVHTKCDLRGDSHDDFVTKKKPQIVRELRTSAKTGLGIEELKDAIRETLSEEFACAEVVPATAIRSQAAIEAAMESLRTALRLHEELLIATELRAAMDRLGEVLGTVHTEDILDHVFSRFCIGK